MKVFHENITNINDIINNTIMKVFNSDNIFIAGGFINSMYLDHFEGSSEKYLYYSDDDSLNKLHNLRNSSFGFGDIDVWCSSKDFDDKALDYESDSISLIRDSRWCKTYCFTMNTFRVNFQIMKEKVTSYQDLFEVFDINACCVVWHKDQVTYNNSYSKFLKNKVIDFNKLPSYDKIHDIVFYSDRLIKYIKKSNYNISNDVLNFIMKSYLDSKFACFDRFDEVRVQNSVYGDQSYTFNAYKAKRDSLENFILYDFILNKNVRLDSLLFYIGDKDISSSLMRRMNSYGKAKASLTSNSFM